MREGVIDDGLLRAVENSDAYRLLRRLEIREGLTGIGRKDGTDIGVVVDVETTGIGEDDEIVELALRRFRFDPDGVVVKIDRSYSWLEYPGRPLPEDIVRLTGITDADLAGQALQEAEIVRLLTSASFVVAHNARFDRPRVERRLAGARGLAWACSCVGVDWRSNGFDGRSLGWLLGQVGMFHGAHRAADDVDAVIALLMHRLPGGGTALADMLERERAPGWRFHAVGAAFELKDALRLRGYRWDADRKTWWREVTESGRDEEHWWLARHVYSADADPKAREPRIERVTWQDRYL
ncbi:DNA polymerase III subunit epsilon [bacterium]|nr:MAG: DNA polymerase III subunit epsilon [bacterium]